MKWIKSDSYTFLYINNINNTFHWQLVTYRKSEYDSGDVSQTRVWVCTDNMAAAYFAFRIQSEDYTVMPAHT